MKFKKQGKSGISSLKNIRQYFSDHPIFIKAAMILAAAIVCSVLLYCRDNSKEIDRNEKGQEVIERGGNTTEEKSQDLKVKIGDMEEEITVTVSGKAYKAEELPEIFAKQEETLRKLILGENKSLDEVRSDLNLVSEIPDTGISVSWESDKNDVVNSMGRIKEEEIAETGELAKLTAVMSYGEAQASHEFYVRVLPQEFTEEEKILESLEEEIKAADEETKTGKYMILPQEVNGEKIKWSYGTDKGAFAILILGVGAAVMLFVSEDQNRKEAQKKKINQMKIDYPQIINKFNLYLSAGMTVNIAWNRIVSDYRKNKMRMGERYAYEEMLYTLHQIQAGTPEGECYENFGMRCQTSAYKKFGIMLSQNLRKGSKGLTELLAREAEEAFEDRKNLAKRLGEEAGTKLMIPMFVMLAIVFVIVLVPAFFSI